jgi:antirestriction protein ArdC
MLDFIQLPPDSAFRGLEYWVTTTLHELSHWTGHKSRLDRDMNKRYASAGYAMEELRAELSSAFIAGELNIPADVPNHASYVQSWLKPLKDNKHEIFRAAADAQRIVDMVLEFHPDFAAHREPRRPEPVPDRQPAILAAARP